LYARPPHHHLPRRVKPSNPTNIVFNLNVENLKPTTAAVGAQGSAVSASPAPQSSPQFPAVLQMPPSDREGESGLHKKLSLWVQTASRQQLLQLIDIMAPPGESDATPRYARAEGEPDHEECK
jgi:hypothetical protein